MRGKGSLLQGDASPLGITPAYAGKSTFVTGSVSAQKDHPRICGEKRYAFSDMICPVGSPPHMRGKACQRRPNSSKHRITPAYAGKSSKTSWVRTTAPDHPRICGEKSRHLAPITFLMGSPPHMRGKAGLVTPQAPCKRITPAYAGKRIVLRC